MKQLYASLALFLFSLKSASSASNYKVYYKARFRWILDVLCGGPFPIVNLSCGDGGTFTFIESNHDGIVVCPQVEPSSAICGVTCESREECEPIFLSSDHDDQSWAEIVFSCEGSTSGNAEAQLVLSSGDGSCNASNSIFLDTRSFFLAQLGAFCTDAGVDGEFVYLSQYFDCRGENTGGSTQEDFAEGGYFCLTGKNCDFSACDIEFDDLIVTTDLHQFDDASCVETSGSGTFPTPAAPPPSFPTGEYEARYRAMWGAGIQTFQCEIASLPTIRITCEGENEAELLSAAHPDKTVCTNTSPSVIECRETCAECENFFELYFGYEGEGLDGFSGLEFKCRGPSFPLATVVYPESSVRCTPYSFQEYEELEATQRVNMEVSCGGRFTQEYKSVIDSMFECGPADSFRYYDVDDSFLDEKYVVQCYDTITSELSGSTGVVTDTMPPIRVFSVELPQDCYSFVTTSNTNSLRTGYIVAEEGD